MLTIAYGTTDYSTASAATLNKIDYPSSFIVPGNVYTFTQVTTATITSTLTTGLSYINCALSGLGTYTQSTVTYDYGTGMGSSSPLTLSDPSTKLCTGTFTMSVAYSPQPPTNDIVFTAASRTLNFAGATQIGVYTVTVTGTLPPTDNRAFSISFTLNLNDVCQTAGTITSPASYAMSYTIGATSAVSYTVPAFTKSPAACAVTYALQEASAISSWVTFAAMKITVGVTSDRTLVAGSPYTVYIVATFIKGTNTGS